MHKLCHLVHTGQIRLGHMLSYSCSHTEALNMNTIKIWNAHRLFEASQRAITAPAINWEQLPGTYVSVHPSCHFTGCSASLLCCCIVCRRHGPQASAHVPCPGKELSLTVFNILLHRVGEIHRGQEMWQNPTACLNKLSFQSSLPWSLCCLMRQQQNRIFLRKSVKNSNRSASHLWRQKSLLLLYDVKWPFAVK